ncbi:MAG TPA: DUF503 domain-containing protein [Candidatus Margulisiibacteriota bacterium]|nr:DUF503 domain-containing protein [Candidatus Margulisiibacteriota bacterium]
MTIGMLRVSLFIPDSSSLKEKRMVLHSLKARLRNNFNVAVTQVDGEDKWQSSTIAVVGVERDRRKMNSLLSQVVNFIQGFEGAELVNQEMELI